MTLKKLLNKELKTIQKKDKWIDIKRLEKGIYSWKNEKILETSEMYG